MKNVKRLLKPPSLSRYSVRWTQKLLDEISRCDACGEKVKDKFYSKYNKHDIKDTLNKMYLNCCCYCESKIGVTDFGHIEHRKPKRGKHPNSFPQLCYDWDNLHLCCTKCNISKGEKFDTLNPILDAAVDFNIENHFTYQLGVGGLLWWPKTMRAKTTEKDADLNRNELAKARLTVFREVYNQLILIKENSANPSNHIALSELKKKANGDSSYSSVIKFLLVNQALL